MTTEVIFYVERRDRTGKVIERLGPFLRGTIMARKAIAMSGQLADLHNRTRRPSNESFQMVYEVPESELRE